MILIRLILAAQILAQVGSGQRPGSIGGTPSAVDLLERYANGDFDAVVRVLTNLEEPDRIRRELEVHGPSWADAGALESAKERRRLVAATLALEFAHARLDEDWISLRSLVEWGCELLRRGRPAGSELVWHQAALALAGAALDDRLLFKPGTPGPKVYNHYAHSESRFPADKRILFAKFFAVPAPARTGSLTLYVGLEPSLDTAAPAQSTDTYGRADDRRDAAKRLMTLVPDPELGGEAALRAGHLLLVNVNVEEALAAFEIARQQDTSNYVKYLSYFLAGRTFERMNRLEDAGRAYEAALGVIPHVQSGVLARSALLMRAGRMGEAYILTSESFGHRPRPDDPWRLFPSGDYYRWPDLIQQLRQAVRP